jgi:iron complex outermembrane receptor protein
VKKLEVETIQTFEVGYKGVFRQKLFVDVNGYYNMSENFISPLVNIASAANPITHRGNTPMSQVVPGTPASGSTFLLTYLNYGEVNTFGADIGLNYYVNNDINVTLNYSFFDFDFDKKDTLRNDGNKDNRIDQADISLNAPKHKIGLGVNARRDKLFGSLFLRWVDEYDFFSGINVASEEHSSVIYGGSPVLENARVGRDFNEGPLGGYVNIDFSLGYHITSQLTISATVVNLFDGEVREFVASPAIGRLISTELKYTF